MKHQFLPVLAFGIVAPVVARTEPPKIEHVIDLLHQAKDSANPLPLLTKAHQELADFKAAPGAGKERAAGIGARCIAGNAVAGHEHKQKAMEAIKAAKAGGDVKPKIEHAIAMAHEAGDLKR